MTIKLRQFTLLLIALSAVTISLFAGASLQLTRVFAQDSATPTTATLTPTGTPTATPTVTGTPPTPTPTVTGTPPTATWTPTPTWTPSVTGTPPTATPTVTGTPPTATWTPTFVGTPTWTPTVTPFGTPAPTPTRPIRVVNEFAEPKAGDAVAGVVVLKGTALIDSYLKYDIHISVAGSDTWRWLITSYDIVHDGNLYRLNTLLFADGFYDLRMRAIREDGNYSETFLRHLEIRNANPPTPTPLRNAEGTLLPTQPPSPILLVATPTPTPRPERLSNIPNGQGIFAPQHGDVLRGAVDIIGTVNSSGANSFVRYEISISNAGQENWTWLYSDEEQFWQESVYQLDTTRLADGFYDLRLRIVYRDSNYNDYFVRDLQIANHTYVAPVQRPTTPTPMLGIFIPASNSMVSGIVEVRGVATINNFLRWELAIAPSGSDQWSILVKKTTTVSGLLARLDLGGLPFGPYDLRLRVISQDNQYQDYFSRQLQLAAPTPTFTPAITTTLTLTATLLPQP
ncbi:MAG: hypothetical protein NT075_04900 [Chloroflexi bacterium]|nr:hypothetical protein [Chloroflexota bacterium]